MHNKFIQKSKVGTISCINNHLQIDKLTKIIYKFTKIDKIQVHTGYMLKNITQLIILHKMTFFLNFNFSFLNYL